MTKRLAVAMCSAVAALGIATLPSMAYAATAPTMSHTKVVACTKALDGRNQSAASSQGIVEEVVRILSSANMDNSSNTTNQSDSNSSSKHGKTGSDKTDITHIITQFEQAIAPYQSNVHLKKLKHPIHSFDDNSTSSNNSPYFEGNSTPPPSGDVTVTLSQSLAAYQTATQDDVQSQSQFESAVSDYISAMQQVVSESKSQLLSSQESASSSVISYLEDALYYQNSVDSGVHSLKTAAAKKQPGALVPILEQMVDDEQQKVTDIQDATKILQDATAAMDKAL